MTITQNLLPRRMIGPDAIKYLRDVAFQTTKNRHAFDAMRVQRNHSGGPAIEIDVDGLEEVGFGHPDSYGTLINKLAIRRAESIAPRLRAMSDQDRAKELQRLLRVGTTWDTTWWWTMSTATMRTMLFPGSYRDGHRCDKVVYLHSPKDFHAGKTILLSELTPEKAEKFAGFAIHLITSAPVDPALVTPVTVN